ncbi:hypothetical protein D3C76_1355710 [compost metagenome]
MRAAAFAGTTCHGLDHLPADRADLAEQLFRHTELEGFLTVGIGDVTGLEPGRTAGDPRDRLGDPAAGAGLGGTHLQLPGEQFRTEAGGQFGDRGFTDGHDASRGQRRWRIPYTTRFCI